MPAETKVIANGTRTDRKPKPPGVRRKGRQARPYRTEMELAAACRRLMQAMARKAADGDPEFLAEMRNLRSYLETAIDQVVLELRARGHTWQSIGDAVGTTRQAAIMRWGRE